MCFTIYIQKKDAFSYVLSLYTQDSYLGCLDYQYFSYIYRNHFFSLAFPSPQYFCIQVKQCFYIQHCLDYGIFLIYENIALSFLIYLAIIFLIGVFLYIVLKTLLFLFYFCPDSLYSFSSDCFLIYIVLNTLFILIFCPDSKFLYLAYIYDIKDILFLLVPPQNLCVFLYIETSFLYIGKTLFFFVFCLE